MTVLRSGANQKYSNNWASAFGEKKGNSTKPVASTAVKKAAKSATVKKKSADSKAKPAGKKKVAKK